MFFLFVAVHIGISLVDDVIDIAERRLMDDIAKGSAGSMGLEMFLDAPQQVAGPNGVLAGRDGQEFITAEAEDFILADDFRQYEGDGLDEQVSLLMAKCVIIFVPVIRAAQMEAVFLFFHQYDAFGGKYLANLGEHMRNALIWVFFADSKIYHVIDRDMLQVCWLLSMRLLRKLLDIYAIRENVVMAVPGNQ